ncbi:MAG TPA: dTDP-4-dehydrorhamnose reductase [Planctomycetaceae bacterium]|jgi:dTDP-4-dehydrorhamnose reductase|nr:dTDP-4-dehydrorhamnose reductase [Planctomycetaceae bacterium]
MRVALVGAAGQLGTALDATRPPDVSIVPLAHAEIEICKAASVDTALSAAAADCVINAAAYNFVDRAEDEPEQAHAANAIGPQNLARWCARHHAVLVHVSTDYVFSDDARRVPHVESDSTSPASVYARSKLAGEEFVRAECPSHFVVRTCGLYGRAQTAGKGNFVRTMLRMASEGRPLKVVDDQHCTPSFAADIAAAIWTLLPTRQFGLYHATNAGQTTWHGFACEILRAAGFNTQVAAIPSRDFPQKAKRPTYSVLDCSKLAAATGVGMPTWQDALGRYVPQIVAEFPRPA